MIAYITSNSLQQGSGSVTPDSRIACMVLSCSRVPYIIVILSGTGMDAHIILPVFPLICSILPYGTQSNTLGGRNTSARTLHTFKACCFMSAMISLKMGDKPTPSSSAAMRYLMAWGVSGIDTSLWTKIPPP
jgi:hypothetical protein